MGCVKRVLLLRHLGGKLTGKIWSKQSTKRLRKNQHGPGNLCLKRWTAERDDEGQAQPGASQRRTQGQVGCSVMEGECFWAGVSMDKRRRQQVKHQRVELAYEQWCWFRAEKARQSTSSNHCSSLKDWGWQRCHLSALCLTRQSRNISFSMQI